jgi:hypothetical protein
MGACGSLDGGEGGFWWESSGSSVLRVPCAGWDEWRHGELENAREEVESRKVRAWVDLGILQGRKGRRGLGAGGCGGVVHPSD